MPMSKTEKLIIRLRNFCDIPQNVNYDIYCGLATVDGLSMGSYPYALLKPDDIDVDLPRAAICLSQSHKLAENFKIGQVEVVHFVSKPLHFMIMPVNDFALLFVIVHNSFLEYVENNIKSLISDLEPIVALYADWK